MRRALVASALLLAACATASPPSSPPIGDDRGYQCRDGAADRFIGQPATQALGQQMIEASGSRTIRWVPFGAMVTMDYSPSRLTVQLDQQNRVNSVKCG